MTVSKSDYMMYLKHPAWLWLKKHDESKLPAIDDNLQAIFDAGHDFEQYAEILFPDAVKLGFTYGDYDSYRTLTNRTKDAIERGEKTIFQGRFEYEGLTFIGDIIDIVDENTVDLYEIKSTGSAKTEHEDDLAFQLIVLEGCGYTVRDISVIHVNTAYVRNGDINPRELTIITNITDAVKSRREETSQRARNALQMIENSNGEHPDFDPLLATNKNFREWVEIYKNLSLTTPSSIYNLCRLSPKLLKDLRDDGLSDMTKIPENYHLVDKQRLQVQALKQGVPVIEYEKIKKFLGSFTYPLYFLDYETMSSLVPYFDGMRPYQQVPFQYSLHVIDSPGAEPRHLEYLHKDYSNPAQAVADSLQKHIGDSGSIITWNMGFEKSCNDTLATFSPDNAEFLQNVNDRIVDLMTPFSKLWYVDPGFYGSASIKAVLPVLVPELSYKDLDIQEGGAAQRIWMQTVLDGKHENDKEQILADLIDYCRLDTLAMVEIYLKLKEL